MKQRVKWGLVLWVCDSVCLTRVQCSPLYTRKEVQHCPNGYKTRKREVKMQVENALVVTARIIGKTG